MEAFNGSVGGVVRNIYLDVLIAIPFVFFVGLGLGYWLGAVMHQEKPKTETQILICEAYPELERCK